MKWIAPVLLSVLCLTTVTTGQDRPPREREEEPTQQEDRPRDNGQQSEENQQQANGQLRPTDDQRMEIGLMLGEPTGISYKYWITDRNAVDAALAIGYVPDAVLQIHANFLRHDFQFAQVGQGRFPLVYGLGAVVQFRDETLFGLRIPVGLTYLFEQLPLSLFIDVAPRIDLIPSTGISINASLGARYRFF